MASGALDAGIYVYPWDVVGDPAAAERVAGLGVSHATVAAFYHATRALTPRHPGHRVVVAERSAAYLPVGPAWTDLLPAAQSWVAGHDVFGDTVAALAGAGVPTHAWVVVDHVDGFGGPHVVNAYDDVYPWALCPANESVLEYAVGLAAVVAERPDIAGIEFEAAGWYGFDHLSQHDKVAGVRLSEDEQFLFSLCFCPACCAAYREAGIDASQLRSAVRQRLDANFDGRPAAPFDADLDAAVSAMRGRVADRLREAMVRELRTQRSDPGFSVAFHATPRPRVSLANTGVDMARLPAGTTGVVVNCWNGSAAPVQAAVGHGVDVYAGLLGIRGMGGDPEGLARVLGDVRAAGAAGVRIYHAGLAAADDLTAIGKALADA
ncbi:hypothetical protein ABH926_009327 [Catenulispora sp. GP43]|uniref:hypothetical protein n=1 Tax=Catenulispora sp. GP43 TaxID=3156263 RepID=UPI003512DA1C